jgi:hypothetical protein
MRRRIWNATNVVMLVAFLFSVAVQYNDPDPVRWMLVYSLAAAACVLEMRRRSAWWFPATVALAAAVWGVTIEPHVAGLVHVADLFASFEMKDATVEQAREMGGLFIVAAWMIVLAVVQFRRRHA